MQAGPRAPGSNQAAMKIYNAVYSSVQVYECMVRGIAVMRRRNDSYVNATQILKVAGVDKGRRTKILEKEILPGVHEIVQGGYGKYQGTWIPLERGRDIANQYGVGPLLAPLFEFQPSTGSMGALPMGTPGGTASPRPLSASSSYSSIGASNNYPAPLPSTLAPPPIMPGSALRLLNQGRAQGLFTPSTSGAAALQNRTSSFTSPSPGFASPHPQDSQTPPPSGSAGLKRNRSEADVDGLNGTSADFLQGDKSRPPSTDSQQGNEDNPSPAKRARTDGVATDATGSQYGSSWPSQSSQPSQPFSNGNQSLARPSSSMSTSNGNNTLRHSPTLDTHKTRLSSRPILLRSTDPAVNKDNRRAAILNAVCTRDDPGPVLDLLRELSSDSPYPDHHPHHPHQNHLHPHLHNNHNNASASSNAPFEVDAVLDEQGHTALHLAASIAHHQIVEALLNHGADMHRGNYLGETPLIRTCLATHNFDNQTFPHLVSLLHPSIHTLDTSRKSVLHHIVSVAGVKGRGGAARYYLEQVFVWIAHHMGGDFESIVDLQDEHGDTALNIAARVGNRSLVKTLVTVGANRVLPNKLGLRPGDFGVETEELNSTLKGEDILASLRSGPTAHVQKSQDVLADMTSMIQSLSSEFQTEIKAKQDSLDVTQAHLRAATRELSEQRKQIQLWQARCAELDQVQQRIRNVEQALDEEESFDWTGRTDPDANTGNGVPAVTVTTEDAANGTSTPTPPPASSTYAGAFQYRGPGSTLVGVHGAVDIPGNWDVDPPVPITDTEQSLIRLRRIKMWQERMEEMVRKRLKGLQGVSAEKEYQCKKIIALCTGLPIDRVEDMIENLVIAVESEGPLVDLARISGFMQKVRDGSI